MTGGSESRGGHEPTPHETKRNRIALGVLLGFLCFIALQLLIAYFMGGGA